MTDRPIKMRVDYSFHHFCRSAHEKKADALVLGSDRDCLRWLADPGVA